MITVAVDCMGGDHGPKVTLPACRRFLDAHPDARLIMVGLPQALQGFSHARACIVVASGLYILHRETRRHPSVSTAAKGGEGVGAPLLPPEQ